MLHPKPAKGVLQVVLDANGLGLEVVPLLDATPFFLEAGDPAVRNNRHGSLVLLELIDELTHRHRSA